MASRLKKLQDKSAAIVAEMRSMLDTCEKEDRQLGSEGHEKEKDLYASLEKRSEDTLTEIDAEKKLEAREKLLAAVPDPNEDTEEEKNEQRVNGREPKPPKKLTLPATVRRLTSLRSFKGDNADAEAYGTGMWLLATVFRNPNYVNDRAIQFCREHGIIMQAGSFEERTAQAEGANTLGGWLVPDILERTIIDLRETYGVFRNNTRVIAMGSDVSNIPRRASGLTGYFVAENTAVTESNKTWDAVQLVAKKLAVLCKYSTELNEDAIISIADDLAFEIGYTFANKEDQCGFNGDGTSTYGGMYGAVVKINDGNHAASIFTATTAHTAFSTLTLADFHGVTGILPQYAKPNAKWYVSGPGFANSMERLMYAGGGNTVSTIGGGSGPSFLGYPVVISQVLNTTLAADVSAIKLLFGDLRLSSTMGTRRGIMIRSSSERYMELDQIGMLGTERFDIVNHDLGDGTTAGPLVALKTPGS